MLFLLLTIFTFNTEMYITIIQRKIDIINEQFNNLADANPDSFREDYNEFLTSIVKIAQDESEMRRDLDENLLKKLYLPVFYSKQTKEEKFMKIYVRLHQLMEYIEK